MELGRRCLGVALLLLCPVLLLAGPGTPTPFDANRDAVRRPPPCPSPRYLIERMVEQAGGRRAWNRVRTLAQAARVEVLDPRTGRVTKSWSERYYWVKCRDHTLLLDTFPRDGKQVSFGSDGHDVWVAVDERPSQDPDLFEEALRRLREVEFWLRFPFCLIQRGTEARMAGWGFVDAGRRPVWWLDVLPATRGDGWPGAPLRLLVNQQSFRLEGVVYPAPPHQTYPYQATMSNYLRTDGILQHHLRSVSTEVGVVAREVTLDRLFNRPLSESLFNAPRFDHY